MIRVLIVDDHAIVREGLKLIIGETPDIEVSDEASNGQEALTKVRNNDYDVVLLDISMPRASGLDILKEIKKEKPRLSILILTIYPEEEYAVRALKDGSSGYLTKDSAPNELIAAIRKVAQGKKYVTASLAEKLAIYLEEGTDILPHERLSNREYQVMRLIASGKKSKEIAEELSLSVKTISTYRIRLLQKMQMKNTAELMLYAIKNFLVV